MEYDVFAKYYDLLYQKKDYKKEVDFLLNFIKKNDQVLDIGCGTGMHASLLEENNMYVDGLDLNKNMLDIAKKRLHGNCYNQNVLDMKLDKRYDAVISMFAVLNHLKSIDELYKSFLNIKKVLKSKGYLLIDLHNPQNSGKKIDEYGNVTRIMEWHFDKENKMEKSNITFIVNGLEYKDSHTFRIFSIGEVKDVAIRAGFNIIGIFENYEIKKEGVSTSKNLQFLLQVK